MIAARSVSVMETGFVLEPDRDERIDEFPPSGFDPYERRCEWRGKELI